MTEDFESGAGDPALSERAMRERFFLEALRRRTPRVYAVPSLIAVNLAIYLAMVVGSGGASAFDISQLIAWGANVGPLTTAGDWWRLLTSTFVHADAIHVTANMLCLAYVGQVAERLLGHIGLLVLYLFTGLVASIFDLLHTPDAAAVGASGAVFGVIGAWVGLVCRHRDVAPLSLLLPTRRAWPGCFFVGPLAFGPLVFIAYSLATGTQDELRGGSHIGHAAHLGGLVSGVLVGLLLDRGIAPSPVTPLHRRAARFALATFAMVAVLPLVRLRVEADPRVKAWASRQQEIEDLKAQLAEQSLLLEHNRALLEHTRALQDALQEHNRAAHEYYRCRDYEEALAEAERAIALAPDSSWAHQLRAWILEALGRTDESLEAYARTIELDPTAAYALQRRGSLLLEQGEIAAAWCDFDGWVKLAPSEAQAHLHRCRAGYLLDDLESALADADRAVELAPTLPEAQDNRGRVLEALNRTVEAKAAYERALVLDPDDSHARDRLAALR